MKPVLWFVLTGLVCVLLTEVLGVTMLLALPPSVEAVGNIIPFVYTPVIVLLALLGGLLLTGNLRRVSLAKALIFPAVYALGQFSLLTATLNPLGYKLTLLAITSTVTVLVVLWRRKGGVGTAGETKEAE